jgi:hypothetical protein
MHLLITEVLKFYFLMVNFIFLSFSPLLLRKYRVSRNETKEKEIGHVHLSYEKN